jgi:hypothetical protein
LSSQINVVLLFGKYLIDDWLVVVIKYDMALCAHIHCFYVFGQSTSMRLWNGCKLGNIFVEWLVMEWMMHLLSRRQILV